MYRKVLSRGLLILVVCVCVTGNRISEAAGIMVANTAVAQDGSVRFDIAWTDSWRASWKESDTQWANWDAAWIFVKYRKEDDPGWAHAGLSTKGADHSAPEGAKIKVGLTGEKGVGVFLYRSAEGKGTWTNKGVKLKWLHKDDGVEDPTKVDIFVHALEMVYVPEGSFKVGGAGRLAGPFTDGSWKKGGDVIPFKVTSEEELKIANEPGCLFGTGGVGAAHQIGPPGKLSAKFPKGYGPFYCQKYEMTQGEYVAFLNQLTETQAAARYPRPGMLPRFADDPAHTINKLDTGYTATKPELSCNWVSWDHVAAYGDWSGLRPMTELEYEKACRNLRIRWELSARKGASRRAPRTGASRQCVATCGNAPSRLGWSTDEFSRAYAATARWATTVSRTWRTGPLEQNPGPHRKRLARRPPNILKDTR